MNVYCLELKNTHTRIHNISIWMTCSKSVEWGCKMVNSQQIVNRSTFSSRYSQLILVRFWRLSAALPRSCLCPSSDMDAISHRHVWDAVSPRMCIIVSLIGICSTTSYMQSFSGSHPISGLPLRHDPKTQVCCGTIYQYSSLLMFPTGRVPELSEIVRNCAKFYRTRNLPIIYSKITRQLPHFCPSVFLSC